MGPAATSKMINGARDIAAVARNMLHQVKVNSVTVSSNSTFCYDSKQITLDERDWFAARTTVRKVLQLAVQEYTMVKEVRWDPLPLICFSEAELAKMQEDEEARSASVAECKINS
jgi:hypothetical protein